VVLKLDLTCIEKTGKCIPFARVFNRRYWIQLVALHACLGGLSFPLTYRIYQGKGKETPVALALELLAQFPPCRWPARVVVMADAGFGSAAFIQDGPV
jgi:Trk-type K+ transport system membrane component